MAKRSKTKQKRKGHQAAKPYPEFPLTAHASGRWCKKHQGRRYYFGKVDDGWEAALAKFERDWSYILEHGRPRPADDGSTDDDGCTLAVLCNAFLNSKRRKMEAGDLAARSFADYLRITDGLIDHFGKDRRVADLQPADFAKLRAKLSKSLGPVSLKDKINRIRIIFNYAHDKRYPNKYSLIDSPVHYGEAFDRPSVKALRKARNAAGPRLFEADEIRRILAAADPAMRAMILLGCNCGFGNSDIANIPQSALDLEAGRVDFPRVKTEIPRRVPLWPETVAALQDAIKARPKPATREEAGLCFLTGRGNRWVRTQQSRKTDRLIPLDALSQKFAKLLKKLEINGRQGLGFYTLRHVFQTVGGDAKDPEAMAAIMGHVDSSMGAVYRERIPDERLQAVVNVVRVWLWPDDESGETAGC